LYYFGQWICGKDEKLDLKPLLLPFQELMYKSGELFSETVKSKFAPIEIELKNPDVRACSKDLYSKPDLEEIDRESARLLESDYIVPSKTSFTSPLMVSRNGGKLRVICEILRESFHFAVFEGRTRKSKDVVSFKSRSFKRCHSRRRPICF
jgi:hypothetical protein